MIILKSFLAKLFFVSFLLCSFFTIFFQFTPKTTAQDLSEKQQEAEIKDDPRVKLKLEQKTQDPATGIVTFLLTIDSKINADRARVSWKLTGQSTLENLEQTTKTLKLQEGEEIKLKINVIPVEFEPLANQPTWKANEFFVLLEVNLIDGLIQATARKNFATSFQGVVLPISKEYEQALSAYQTQETLKTIGLILIVISIIAFGILFFRSWINIDEQELFEKTGGKISLLNKLVLSTKNLFSKKSSEKDKTDNYEY